jgi:hypothetical protein
MTGMLAINVLLAIIAASLASHHVSEGQGWSAAILYSGKCAVSKHWETGLHLAINILSTVMLAMSNYCMQGLVAPSRTDVDRAHSNNQWLEIGSASLKNLLAMNTRSKVLWSILCLTSTPFHLLYALYISAIICVALLG